MKSNAPRLRNLLTVFALLLCAFPALASEKEGGMTSGGGQAVVCRGAKNKIRKAEMFDLFEGRNRYRWPMQKSLLKDRRPYLEIAKEMGARIDLGPASFIKNSVPKVDEIKKLLPDEAGLKEINDSFSNIMPKRCKVEQVAAYLDSGELLVDGEIWRAFDKLNKAALIVHEALYRRMRDDGEKNSIRARRAVAAAFSGKDFSGARASWDYLAGGPMVFCTGKDEAIPERAHDQKFKYLFIIRPIDDSKFKPEVINGRRSQKARIDFLFVNGVRMISQTHQDVMLVAPASLTADQAWRSLDGWKLSAWPGGPYSGAFRSVVDFDLKMLVEIKNDSEDPDENHMVAGPFKGERPDVSSPESFEPISCHLGEVR
jgi:hypothetical protein